MANKQFNLDGLTPLFRDAVLHKEPTLGFEVAQGRGRFVFMMFFSEEDKESRDLLFVYLRHTRVMLDFKLYGNHFKGDFRIFIDPVKERAMVEELQLGHGDVAFEFEGFLRQLNGAFPAQLPLQATLDTLRAVWPQVGERLRSVVDEAARTILIGIRRLGHKKPREKTLRKLYLHTNGDARTIRALVTALKAAHITLAWTDDPTAVAKSFVDLMGDVRRAGGRPSPLGTT
ncbi:hypothetical protein [Piscinibacter terrae]|uniref:Uncharacterized protein n=1 Tax=Piscinibacter terrae TaxID=2496871 RepID=A0A3N7HJY5_9BURK|nr:hypothetical protein [Albitalea terrae]RQP21843.1 hypothetical protein DZC73_25730 [Albitalea terrae]